MISILFTQVRGLWDSIFILIFVLVVIPATAQSKYTIASIPPALLKNTNSVLIDEVLDVDVSQDGKLVTKKLLVWAVLNEKGNNDPRLFEHYDSNTKVKKIEAVIYDAFGNKKEQFKKKNFSDVSESGYATMYGDSRVLYKRYTPGAYPYIVVFQSETESGDTAFIPRWVPLSSYYESTLSSRYEITFNPSNKIRYKPRNLDGFDISISETPGKIIFTASNLEAIRYEDHSPAASAIFPGVHFALDEFVLKGKKGSAKTWNDFGKWMNTDLLSDVNVIPEATLNKVRSLISEETTNEGKAKKIYQYLQDKVRYISIQIGIGGWKPLPASDVDKLSYGDCKALTNYTKALLDAFDIPSYYTILYGDKSGTDIMEDFVSIQGNHVILGVPDGDNITWLECTSQSLPYGFIGSFTEDRDALILTPDGGEIVRTRVYTTDENFQENIGNVTLASSGKISANLIRTSGGTQYENKYLLPKKKKDEIEIFYKKSWGHINGFSISENTFNDNRDEVLFTEALKLEIPAYVQAVSDGFLFAPNLFNQLSYIPPKVENRQQPLKIHSGFLDVDTVSIQLPKDYIAEGIPEPVAISTIFGSYKSAITVSDSHELTYTRELRMEKGLHPASEYDNYREFLRTVARLDQTKILIKTAH